MKKKITSLLVALVMLTSSLWVSAANENMMTTYKVDPRASSYLSSYTLGLKAEGGGEMSISFSVLGTGIMTKIGAQSIVVEQKVGSSWIKYVSYSGDSDGLYDYNSPSGSGGIYFNAMPGMTYRATMVAYAANARGSDTGEITCASKACT